MCPCCPDRSCCCPDTHVRCPLQAQTSITGPLAKRSTWKEKKKKKSRQNFFPACNGTAAIFSFSLPFAPLFFFFSALSCFAPITSHVMSTKGHVTCQVACGKGLVACYTPPNTSNKPQAHPMWKQGGVSHCGLAIFMKKYLKAKEELRKLKYFTMQKCNLQKIL